MADPTPPVVEFDRTAVVTIQGGGIYGLNMLGQLSALLEYGITPLAFAGTSAGAVVATLAWAGYAPKEIRNLFADLSIEPKSFSTGELPKQTLVDLLGPFGEQPLRYDYDRFHVLAGRIKARLGWIGRIVHGTDDLTLSRCLANSGLIPRRDIILGVIFSVLAVGIGLVAIYFGSSWHLISFVVLLVWMLIITWVGRQVLRVLADIWGMASEILTHSLPRCGFGSCRPGGDAPLYRCLPLERYSDGYGHVDLHRSRPWTSRSPS